MKRRLSAKNLKRRGNLIRILVPLTPEILEGIEEFHPNDDRTVVIRHIVSVYIRSRKQLKKELTHG